MEAKDTEEYLVARMTVLSEVRGCYQEMIEVLDREQAEVGNLKAALEVQSEKLALELDAIAGRLKLMEQDSIARRSALDEIENSPGAD